jgi:hypothetical protein
MYCKKEAEKAAKLFTGVWTRGVIIFHVLIIVFSGHMGLNYYTDSVEHLMAISCDFYCIQN